jgi:hypothetical protein
MNEFPQPQRGKEYPRVNNKEVPEVGEEFCLKEASG